MDVNDLVQQRIEAARRKAEADKRRRAELAAAREAGLARRHAAKLRRTATPPEGFATPAGGAANTPEKELPMPVMSPFRVVPCPSCRAQRTVRRVGTVTLGGVPYEIVRCPDSGCSLQWLAHPERPRTSPAAA